MHGGAAEGSAELSRVHGVGQGDQGVGDCRADVGTHHDGDGRSYIQNCKQGARHSAFENILLEESRPWRR